VADDACGVAPVLCAVRGVNPVIDARVGLLHEVDIFYDATGAYPAFVANPRCAEPGGRAPVNSSDLDVITEVYDPNRHWISQRAFAPQWRYLQLIRCFDLVEFIVRPCRH
jgi:hypothetical protein